MTDTDLKAEITSWRHHLHEIPELGFKEFKTADFIAEKLASFGVEVTRGVGGTGVVGTLRRGNGKRSIGFRADMDALAIPEAGTPTWRSTHEGRTHACGHDGHMAIVIGAALLLSRSEKWSGTVHFIFQPDEEHGGGAKAMLADDLVRRFPMSEIYGIHNMPGLPEGQFATRVGGIMASEDNFVIRIQGLGSHAARPHMGVDPIMVASQIATALQTIISRNLDPTDQAVVSITEIIADGTRNVIPGSVMLKGDTRSYSAEVRALLERRMGDLAAGICAAYGAICTFEYTHEFEPTINRPEFLPEVLAAAEQVVGFGQTDGNCRPILASEDFGAMLNLIPGNYMFLGSGLDALPLHNPAFDFNDRLLVPGARYFATLAECRCRPDSAGHD